jgi:spermidine synthase
VVGSVYAANTVGAIIGALVFSMVVVPWLGTRGSQRMMIGLAAVSALLLLVSVLRRWQVAENATKVMHVGPMWVGLPVVPALAILLIWYVPPTPWGLTAYGRHMATWADQLIPGIMTEQDVPSTAGNVSDIYCLYAREGMSVSAAVTQSTLGVRSFHGAGKVQASNDPRDMRLQRMLGHIPALVQGHPESVLVVACGAGVTAGSFVPHPTVKRIVICDIEPIVPRFVAPYFKKENYDVVNDPRTEVVCDDGRHFVRTTQEKFDVITSDPIDPWVKGCAALNTLEYYTMCREHLNPGGVMALWMPLYESNPETAKSLIATFFRVFPNGILWSNDSSGDGYDAVLFGQVEPTQINLDELQQKLDRPEYLKVSQSLMEVGFPTVTSLLATYVGRASGLQGWMQDAQLNTDRNLRLQYLAGMSLNSNQSAAIFGEIIRSYEFPSDLFVGSSERVTTLQQELEHAGRVANMAPPQP